MNVGLLFQILANNAQALQALLQLQNQAASTTAAISANFSKMAGAIGSTMTSMGSSLSLSVTAPIAAAAFAVGRFGLDIQALKNQLTAFEGSSEAAEARLASLRSLVDGTAGATREMAYEIYGMLKPLRTSDETIDKTIASIARLKLGFKNLMPSDFTYNLTQIFGQGFEEQDIKQAIGQVPKFREYLVKAFGTSDNATLKEMKNSGKITMESFFTGIADAVQNDSMLAGLMEPTALRMQKFFEKTFEAVEPLANRIVEIIANLIDFALPYLEQFASWFKELSPLFQTIIVAVGAVAAALGPLLVVLGSVAGAIGTIIGGIGAVAGAVAAVGLVPILAAIAAVAVGVTIVFAEWIAIAAALYKAFQINFGGIRDYMLQAFTFIKEKVGAAMNDIYDTVQTVGGSIVGWWKDNYSQIRQTVETVSNAVKATIEAFLSNISAFWSEHGERIKTFVSSAWQLITTVIAGAVDQIRNVVQLAMQVINNDWENAWQSILKITESGGRSVAAIWKLVYTNILNLLSALIPVVTEIFLKMLSKSLEISTKIVAGVVYIFATLPQRLIELVPKFYAAMQDVGAAIWKGIKDGWDQAEKQNPLDIPKQVVGNADGGGATGGLSSEQNKSSDTVADTSILESQRKKREEALKKQLELLKRYNKLEVEDAQQKYNKVDEAWKKALENNAVNFSFYKDNMLESLNNFESFSLNLMEKGFALNTKGKTGQELTNEQKQYEIDKNSFTADIEKQREEILKRSTDAEKKQNESRIKSNQESAQKRLENEERLLSVQQAKLDAKLAKELMDEETHQLAKSNLILSYTAAWVNASGKIELYGASGFLQKKKELLQEHLKEVAGNAEAEAQINKDLADVENQIQVEYYNREKLNAEIAKKSLEDRKKLEEELLEVKKELAEEERRINDFRADQERKALENTLEYAKGKARLDALKNLRNFETADALRRKNDILDELQTEEDAALERIKGKANEEKQKFEIEEAYKLKRLGAEEEFQKRLKEIQAQFNPPIKQQEEVSDGFASGLFGSLGQSILFEQINEGGEVINNFSNAWKTLGDIAGQTLGSMAQGIGNMVNNLVLMGNLGGQSFRKLVASVLASVASQAAVLAVMETAYGIAALTPWGAAIYGNPINHFKAAALFGSIALTTGLLGRAVAGDSFNTNSAAKSGFASATGGSSDSSNGRSSGGTQYSSHGDEKTVIDENRIRRDQVSRHEITLKMPRGFVVESIEQDFRDRGPIYDLITTEY